MYLIYVRFSVEVISVYNLQATKSKEPHNLFFCSQSLGTGLPKMTQGAWQKGDPMSERPKSIKLGQALSRKQENILHTTKDDWLF